ncbi:ras association domain-containing protein 5 isoform X2 [Notothenia coriiceps]|uniref:Ras association domain-containing protein 5 isoform X2 n=1 Tax=Notothenia coriiceps TaxID=8208 RepID=A0A6I9PDC5_9TELE|nr:PREDICTED: ras association domain-containing protein 5 isoform X2 [Notothenia coriiceps]
MASMSVVGQHPGPHRLDSEPLLFKLAGARKKITLPRISSWDKMMFRRSSGSGGDCGAATTEGQPGTHPLSPGPAGTTAVKAGPLPVEGCGAPTGPATPRSPDRDREEGSMDSRTAAGLHGSQTGNINSDYNSNTDCYTNRNTGSRRGSSLKRLGINVMANGADTNGHKGSHRHRVAADGRRDSRSRDSGQPSVSPPGPAPGLSGSLSLERLTQGRTGVVKLARTELPRREAWSIFPRGVDPRVRTEKGEGHRFESKPCTQDWCDACSRQITAQALKCDNCSYTCHLECESRVQLDCNRKDREEETPSPRRRCSSAAPQYRKEAKEEETRGTKDLSEEEVSKRIEEYNAQVSENGMNLASDGSYTGFIKVKLRLSRPVTVPAVEAGDSEGASRQAGGRTQPSEGQDVSDCGQSEKRTSFYLPSDCVKQIHIRSLTTVSEVIQGLLKKFMVLDNPRKFALYRQTHRDGQDLLQKLPLCERPLLLRLITGPDPEHLSFVLKENETGEVEWYAFSVPELQNFLVILGNEEAERVRAVEQKYTAYRQKLQRALQQHDP